MVARMRRAMSGVAAVAVGLLLAAGCTSGAASPSSSAPSTNGIGPITLAIPPLEPVEALKQPPGRQPLARRLRAGAPAES